MGSSSEISIGFGTDIKNGNTHDHEEGGLDLELFVDFLVLDRVVLQLPVETVALCCFDDVRWEELKRKAMKFGFRVSTDVRFYEQDLSHAVFNSECEQKVGNPDRR